MIKILLSITATAIISILAAFYFSSIYFRSVIQEQAEEERLQSIAHAQLLSEYLDAGNTQLLRERINSQMLASLTHTDPENSYNYIHRNACKIHQLVYEYRAKHPELYNPETPEEQMAQEVLEYWSKKDCGA